MPLITTASAPFSPAFFMSFAWSFSALTRSFARAMTWPITSYSARTSRSSKYKSTLLVGG